MEGLEEAFDLVGAAEVGVWEVEQGVAQGVGLLAGQFKDGFVVDPHDEPVEDESLGVGADGVALAGEVDDNLAGTEQVGAVIKIECQGVADAVVDLDAVIVPVFGDIGAWFAVLTVAEHGYLGQAELG